MHVTFNSAWGYDLEKPKGGRRRFNAGWSGELDDKIGKDAIEAGVASETGKPAKKKAETPPAPDYDKMSDDDLVKLAAERKLDVSKAKSRADVIAALKAADAKK